MPMLIYQETIPIIRDYEAMHYYYYDSRHCPLRQDHFQCFQFRFSQLVRSHPKHVGNPMVAPQETKL